MSLFLLDKPFTSIVSQRGHLWCQYISSHFLFPLFFRKLCNSQVRQRVCYLFLIFNHYVLFVYKVSM